MAPNQHKSYDRGGREGGGAARQTERERERLLAAIFTSMEIPVWDKLLSGQPLIEDDEGDWTASKV